MNQFFKNDKDSLIKLIDESKEYSNVSKIISDFFGPCG